MSNMLVGTIGIAILLFLMALRVPIAFSFMISGIVGFTLIRGYDSALSVLGIFPYSETASYALLTIPLFILMGQFVSKAKIAEDLYDAGYKWLGHLPGGLAQATTLACTGFAACTGSSMACALTIGALAVPEMKRYNYDTSFSTGCVAAGGTLGILIPPSIIFIIYGYMTETSIGKLFIAGIIPGIMLASIIIFGIYLMCRLRPSWGPRGESCSWKARIISLKGVWGVLVLFVLIIGGLYIGIFTPTEAGAIGSFGAFIFAVVRRGMTVKVFFSSLKETVSASCMGLTILVGAMMFNSFMSLSGIPRALSDWVTGLPLPASGIVALILILYIPLGCFFDSLGMMVLTLPFIFPTLVKLNVDPIWFGVLVTVMCEIALISPPVGINAYAMSGATGVPLQQVFRGAAPFIAMMLVGVAILFLFPQISLFLPSIMK
jgi:C4-dicarboxylate transporter DctM subunit